MRAVRTVLQKYQTSLLYSKLYMVYDSNVSTMLLAFIRAIEILFKKYQISLLF